MAGRRRELTIDERKKIIELRESGTYFRAIARIIGCGVSTAFDTVSRFAESNSYCNRPGRGRFSVVSERDKRYIASLSRRNRRKTATQLTQEFNIGRKNPVSKSTIRKILQNYGMNGRIGCKKPLLRKVNIAKRLMFAQKHVMWTKAQWSKVIILLQQTKTISIHIIVRFYSRMKVNFASSGATAEFSCDGWQERDTPRTVLFPL